MQLLSGLVGINASGGETAGSTTGTSTGSTADTKTPTYTGDQSGLQALLSKVFSSLLPAAADGGISPNVQATETAANDQINKSSSTMGDRMNRFLAQRGFGKSGSTGKAALSTELGRESALGANASAAAGQQLQQNNTSLADALQFAFTNPGSQATGTSTGTTAGTSSGSGFGVGVGAKGSFGVSGS